MRNRAKCVFQSELIHRSFLGPMTCPTLPCFTYPTLLHPIMPTPPYPTLSYPILSYPILSYPTPPHSNALHSTPLHSTPLHSTPGRRSLAGDRAGTFCPESQLESAIYYNQGRSRHASLGCWSTTEPFKDYQNPNSWSRSRGHKGWRPLSPESELEPEPSGHQTRGRSRSQGRNASLELEPEPFKNVFDSGGGERGFANITR